MIMNVDGSFGIYKGFLLRKKGSNVGIYSFPMNEKDDIKVSESRHLIKETTKELLTIIFY